MSDADANTIRPGYPVVKLPGVTKARAAKFARLEVATVGDLLRYLPVRYEDEAAETGIDDLPQGQVGSARGEIVAARWVASGGGGRSWGRKGRFEVMLRDSRSAMRLTWFNAKYLTEKLRPGLTLRVQGKMKPYNGYPQMANPTWEIIEEDEQVVEKVARLRPVYSATQGLPSKTIEKIISDTLPLVLPDLVDPLPQILLEHHAMPALAEAFRMAHQPTSKDEAKTARRRLAFNELLLLQLGISLKRAFVRQRLVAHALPHNDAIDAHIRSRFPFELTDAQRQVITEITADLAQPRPMNRLLQGDVGAGKTVVALYALLLAVADRKQGAIMAPTELLAEQHFQSISKMLEGTNVRIALLTGTAKSSQDDIASGRVDLVVGTHALLNTTFQDLAVVVIDEQHRFGVMQRAAFRSSDESKPHVPHHLVMTATPIPRTLSLTVFGDLDVSTIRGLPPGRTPITNRVVPSQTSDEVYRYLRTRLERGEQAYVVVPTIDAGDEAEGKTLTSVHEHAKLLQNKYCEGYKVASVHGRLKSDTRDRVMRRFRDGEIHVLVATTVIEVGVDVPNATVMIVEHAERFGLAQLHQLRGRVGRGTGRRSLCVFIGEPTTEDAERRLEAIASTNDGFRIAELDLEIRGMGDFFGTRQHGAPPLRIAAIPQDMNLLQLARRDAMSIVEADPALERDEHLLLRKVLLQQYGGTLGLIDVG